MKQLKYICVVLFACISTTLYAGSSDLESFIQDNGSKSIFTAVIFYDKADSADYKAMAATAKQFVNDNSRRVVLREVAADSAGAASLVEKYRLLRAPMPLLLVFAPNGAITRGYAKKVELAKLQTSLVGPIEQKLIKYMQQRKPVVIRIPGKSAEENTDFNTAISDFEKLRGFKPEVLEVTALSKDDKKLEKKYGLNIYSGKAQTVVLTTAGTVAGSFSGKVSAEDISEALKNAGSSCCANNS